MQNALKNASHIKERKQETLDVKKEWPLKPAARWEWNIAVCKCITAASTCNCDQMCTSVVAKRRGGEWRASRQICIQRYENNEIFLNMMSAKLQKLWRIKNVYICKNNGRQKTTNNVESYGWWMRQLVETGNARCTMFIMLFFIIPYSFIEFLLFHFSIWNAQQRICHRNEENASKNRIKTTFFTFQLILSQSNRIHSRRNISQCKPTHSRRQRN